MNRSVCARIDTSFGDDHLCVFKSHKDSLAPYLNKESLLENFDFKSRRKLVYCSLMRQVNVLTPKQHRELIEGLEQKINDCLETPIEVFEEKLEHLCFFFSSELQRCRVKGEVIEIFHLVNILQEENADGEKLAEGLMELHRICEIYLKSYEFACELVKLLNDLCLVYGIIDVYSYKLRFDDKIEKIRFLNLRNLYSDIINMEVIWLSFICDKAPLKHILNLETRLLGKLLREEFEKTVEVFMQSSVATEDFGSVPAWLAKKNKRLVEDYGFHRRDTTVKGMLNFQGLSRRLLCCFITDTGLRAQALQDQLIQFEHIYHVFEAAILKTFYQLESVIQKF